MGIIFSFDIGITVLNYFSFYRNNCESQEIIFYICFPSESGCEQNHWFIERGARGRIKPNTASNILLEIFKGKACLKCLKLNV